MILLAWRAFACSPSPGVFTFVRDTPVPPGTVLRGWSYLPIHSAALTTPDGDTVDLPLLPGAPSSWAAVQLPGDLPDGAYTLDFDDQSSEHQPVPFVVDALALPTAPDAAPILTSVTAETAHTNGEVCDTGAGGPWARFTIDLDLPPAQSPAWIAAVATDDGDPVGWAWLSYPYDPHPVVYTTPLEPGARLCFVAQLRDPFDTPTGASSTACADMPDVPTEAADVGCGCMSTPSPAPDLLALTGFLLLRRRRYQRLRTSLLDIA